MKIVKNVSFRNVTLATVKRGQECFVDGLKVIKVAPKLVMTTDGSRVPLTDATMVKIRL